MMRAEEVLTGQIITAAFEAFIDAKINHRKATEAGSIITPELQGLHYANVLRTRADLTRIIDRMVHNGVGPIITDAICTVDATGGQ
jgi:hypothetical protein